MGGVYEWEGCMSGWDVRVCECMSGRDVRVCGCMSGWEGDAGSDFV